MKTSAWFFGVILFSIALGTGGCGSAKKPTPQTKAANQANSTTAEAQNSGTEAQIAIETAAKETAAAQNAGSQQPNAPTAEVSGSEAFTAIEKESKPSESVAKETPVEPAFVAVQPFVEPTPEQIAIWSRAPFKQLQLLACRYWEKSGVVTEMVHLPDGQHYILAGSKVALWSIGGESPDHVFFDLTNAGKNQFIRALAISPNGKWFAAGDSEGTLKLWSLADRKELNSKRIYNNDITQIAISPDGQDIATMTYSSEVSIWSAAKLDAKNKFKVETNGLKRIMYMAPNELVAAGETTTSWNVTTGKLVQSLSPGRYRFSLSRSRDGKQFVIGDNDNLQFWDVGQSKRAAKLVGGFASNELVEFSPDGKFLATLNGSNLRIWDLASQQVVQVADVNGSALVGLSWLPETQLLLVASENGRTRLWGSPESGTPLGLKPLVANRPAGKIVPAATGAATEPATPAQLLEAIDLRSFPRLTGGVPRIVSDFSLDYSAPVKPDEAKQFYRYFLRQSGWVEIPTSATSTPGAINFRKSGFMLSVNVGAEGDANSTISLHHAGNYDMRWVPKFDAAPIETTFENEDVVHYRTKADLIQIETNLYRKLHAAGWTAYSRLNSSHNDEPDRRDLTFLRNGATLHISIGRFPVDPASYTVQCGSFLTLHSLPVPQDSGFVEFDGSTQPYLVATTAMNLAQTREFYDKTLTAQGWLPLEAERSLKDDANWLPYIQGQQDLMIGLARQKNGRTLIRVGDGLENSSWQLTELKPADSRLAALGIEAADFPIVEPAKSAKFNPDQKSLEVQMDATGLIAAGEKYTKELEAKGWKLKPSGIKADDYVFLIFVKEKAEIELRARLSNGNAVINIQGDGLLWTKPLPGGKQVESYEHWLRTNRHPATLELLDQYEKEMRSIAPKK